MPNRIIKETICTSENLDQLSPEAEVFFYRLMVNCDDFGRFSANPQILRSKLYPLKVDIVRPEMVEAWLIELIGSELIFLYEAEGKRLLQIQSWNKHQQKRAKHSKYPTYDSTCMKLISHDIGCKPKDIRCDANEITCSAEAVTCGADETTGNHLPANVPENREPRNEKRESIKDSSSHLTADGAEPDMPEELSDPEESQASEESTPKEPVEPTELKTIYSTSGPEYKLAEYLLGNIRELDPKARQPNLQGWAADIDKMIRLDKRSASEIKDLIDFVQSDTFWRSNILSGKKLREKATTLTAKMKEKSTKGGPGYGSNFKPAGKSSETAADPRFSASRYSSRQSG